MVDKSSVLPLKVPITIWFVFAYLCFTVAVNLFVLYPTDNDLDAVGWLVSNFSFTRLESLANATYPFALSTLFYLLTPLFGLLRAALVLEAIAMALVLLLSYKISLCLFKCERTASITVVLSSLLVFESATSEFLDGVCAVILYLGFFLVVKSGATIRSFFIFGLLVGVASLFRYHYLSFLAVIPIASFILPGSLNTRLIRAIVFGLGLLVAALPQLLINFVSHGDLLGHDFQNYQIGQHMVGIDWNNFLETYNHWPLERLIKVLGWEFAWHMSITAAVLFSFNHVWLTFMLTPIAVYLVSSKSDKKILVFILATMLLYTIIIVLPTRYTDRSLLPFTILAACIIAPCLHSLGKLVGAYSHRIASAIIIILAIYLIGHPLQSYDYISTKYAKMKYNQEILRVLYDAGMQNSSEVYCNYWRMYPLDDPEFVTFYNHGGWLLLDGKYARERPNPERPKELPAWQSFFRDHQLKYAVLRKDDDSYREFFTDNLPTQWGTIFEDSNFLVLTIH